MKATGCPSPDEKCWIETKKKKKKKKTKPHRETNDGRIVSIEFHFHVEDLVSSANTRLGSEGCGWRSKRNPPDEHDDEDGSVKNKKKTNNLTTKAT